MMRCVRFATQLNFQIEPETYEALKRNADRLKIISGERIADELNKIMLAKHPSSGFYYLKDTGLLELIIPELCALDKVETRNGRAHKTTMIIQWRFWRMSANILIISGFAGLLCCMI